MLGRVAPSLLHIMNSSMKFIIISSFFIISISSASARQDDVVFLTVASNSTDGYQRYIRSASVYDIPVTTLGKGVKWTGGNMNYAGGGQKINLIKKQLEKMKDEGAKDDKIVIFTDSYDVIFLGDPSEIVKTFLSFENTRVLFSAEQFCWPDEALAAKYPNIEGARNKYLNSGGFIGYFKEIYEIISHTPVKDKDDDQLYYTKVYLDENLRKNLKIRLDHKSQIFQNLNGAVDEIELHINDSITYPYISNMVYNVKPLILHGNGPSKIYFNSLTNYLAKSWSPQLGCLKCEEKRKLLDMHNVPTVVVAVFVEQATPFIEEFFLRISSIDYPKDKIHLFVRNNVPYHKSHIKKFTESSSEYASFKQITPEDKIDEGSARMLAIHHCSVQKCDYLFVVDSIVHLDNKDTLRDLVEANLPFVAPMVTRSGKAWSNFWGALTLEGFYARSIDYMEIVHLVRRGVWNVPFINSCYLMNAAEVLRFSEAELTYKADNADPDMKICSSLRELGVFMYIMNEKDYGHLIDPETYDVTLTNPDVYQIFENKWDWEQRYIHAQYPENFNLEKKPAQPCPDVYWFPMTTTRFCKEYIEIMEAFGKWSDGANDDKRLEGGYEAVPTRDIHTNQVGLERHWLYILQQYVRPLQELVFTGYIHDPPRSLMNFVVRYKPDEQPSLRPHHDSSTYTINLALNTPGADYQGGGCHFIRYNCSVRDTRSGWLLMHPGRLTHYHEGLLVTEGVRYIMVSFVDP
ncbi:procollagen lysyl hydroxylase [Arctopsyche grandis]|uniref:procollagen lysyl hydroxylase n=1 Tax=Arctopsyche grandis TaxID=121162 RepID=UPI00406D7933